MDDAQFELSGVVPGDVEGAVKQVALRMSTAAREDPKFAAMLAELAASRGGIDARALEGLDVVKTRHCGGKVSEPAAACPERRWPFGRSRLLSDPDRHAAIRRIQDGRDDLTRSGQPIQSTCVRCGDPSRSTRRGHGRGPRARRYFKVMPGSRVIPNYRPADKG
jgi:hypothetical protein